ncbi:FAD-dependent oxidoreductase [Luteolibacter yonseiensis]|uniref:FAD-dependent oxidoreductase n=1 Tax=Luteolibacter yonseiensis TaxID=1144680 RepID=A0A934R872_9BACT|nr:FAD-dependent oxidoreductase [Luteolibacter yonseiensis]MBK1817015.1 FAD-dependent oxidoreductase [Luteolibacter yonseiensis]
MQPVSLPRSVFFLTLALSTAFASAHPEEFDVVVYGGTSGGVTAAVAGAKMGKKVALVSPTTHLGGLTTSGLGWTDMGKNLGKNLIIGGLSREFYHRVYLHYAAQPNWNSVKSMAGQHMAAFDQTNQLGYIFEPKVATKIYDDMLAETTVKIFTGLLDLTGGVTMNGRRITSIKLEDGRAFRGKMFIDASYEGDVMAGAGVGFHVGREANSVYGETINGVYNAAGNEVVAGLDSYKVKGNPASGLLPGIRAGVAANGTADGNLQAYCYRMCLTNNAANRVMIAKPANYRDEDFELVLRAVETGQTQFLKMDAMPNGKTDSNNSGGISLDYIGKNWGPGWDWTTLNHAERAALAEEHAYWQLGLIWTIQNHPRVLAKVGAKGLYSGWGLPLDEFTDTGNFPPQLYVREARRMVSDYVMTTKNCAGTVVAPDSVGMAAYTMDSHNTQLFNNNGTVKNEGGVGAAVPAPYPISYRSLIPKTGQCENLLVPWCLSTSHMAFGSARMEPVFMTMGQSAATAAALAINEGTSVQQVSYEKLASALRADGQVLDLAAASGTIVDTEDATGVVITGSWTASSTTPGFNATNYLHDGGEGRGQKSVRFTPVIPSSGNYRVSLRWNSNANRATNVPITLTHGNGVANSTVNQQANGGVWFDIGVFSFNAGTGGNLLLSNTGVNGHVIADAAMWTRVDQLPTVGISTPVPSTIRGGTIPAAVIFTREGDTAAPLQVFYEISGNADPSGLKPQPAGSVTIAAGRREFKLPLAAISPALPQGEKTLVLRLSTRDSYLLAEENRSATIVVRDNPFDSWRLNRFNPTQLSTPSISGPFADPDGSGVVNLLRFFSGRESGPRTSIIHTQGAPLYFQFERQTAAAGLGYSVQESEDLLHWSDTPVLPRHAPVEEHEGVQLIQLPVGYVAPLAEGRKFFRLNVVP